MRYDAIIAYTYAADFYCPNCIVRTYAGQTQTSLDGLSVDNSGNVAGSVESVLDALAGEANIDRKDEASFDSGDFPKVMRASMLGDERCGKCGDEL